MVIDPLGNYHIGGGKWIYLDTCYYVVGNEDKDQDEEGSNDNDFNNENGDVEPPEEGVDLVGVAEACHMEGYIEEGDEEEEGIYELEDWERRGRAVVQERLKEIKTCAQVIIL
ncbi:hypothetical protein ACLB2K_054177 [Fragaria x ananassa]